MTGPWRAAGPGLLAACLAVAPAREPPARPAGQADPFGVVISCAPLSAQDRARAETGSTVARSLPEDDRRVAVFGAQRTSADGARLVAWVRRIDALKRSDAVVAIARLSDPPAASDLDGLSLDAADLDAIRRCRPGDCAVKLTAAEIARLRAVTAAAGDDWRARVQIAFRELVLERLAAYRAGGHGAIGRYADGGGAPDLSAVFRTIVDRSACLGEPVVSLARALERYPSGGAPWDESFFYWSKERFGGKPVILVTHVVVARGRGDQTGDAFVVSTPVFATHYINGGLNLTAVVGARPGTPGYLIVLDRLDVDVVSGMFGFLARRIVEGRLRSELDVLLPALVRRLESGEPGGA